MRKILNLLTATAIILSCSKSPDARTVSDPVDLFPYTADIIESSVTGMVVDENNAPKAGVTVKAGTAAAQTDTRGFFRIAKTSQNKNAGLVTAESIGYFKAFRTISLVAGTTSFVSIQLIPRILTGTVNGNAAGSVTLIDNTTISFPAGAFMRKATGVAYTGPVKVFARPIDPTAAGIAQVLPGSFMGVDAAGARVLLKSYGMLVAELESIAGEALQLAPTKKATILQPIPGSLVAGAPATIPLWYLDENDGLWKQEGEGVKIGNSYQGTVSHFTPWNFDDLFQSIFLEMTIVDESGSPMPNTFVKISSSSGPFSTGYTDSRGYIRIPFASDLTATLEVMGGSCNTVLNTRPIGPFAGHTNIGNLVVTAGSNTLKIGGLVKDCNGQPVVRGNVLFYFEGKYYNAFVDGAGGFKATVPYCHAGTDLEIYAIDVVNNMQGTPANVNIPATNVQALNLGTCASAVGAGGTLFLGTCDVSTPANPQYKIHAVDAETGRVNWEVNTYPGSLGAAKAVYTFANGKLYFGDFAGLNAFDTLTKTRTLVSAIPNNDNYHAQFYHYAPLLYNNSIYFSSAANITNPPAVYKIHRYDITTNTTSTLGIPGVPSLIQNSLTVVNGVIYGSGVAVNASDFTLKWANPNMYPGPSSPVVSNNLVFFAFYNTFYARDAQNGQTSWTYQINNHSNSSFQIFSSPTIFNGNVYFGAPDSTIYALSQNTGSVVWKKKLNEQIRASPVIGDNTLFINTWRGGTNVYAFDPASGAEKWSIALPTTTNSELSPLYANGMLYLGGYGQKLYAIAGNTGFIKWSVTLGQFMQNSPIVVDNNGIVHHPGPSGEAH